MGTKIVSNGSKWYGQTPDDLSALLRVLEEHDLDMRQAPFVYRHADGTARFAGNFRRVSQVFHIVTDEPDVIVTRAAAIARNVTRVRAVAAMRAGALEPAALAGGCLARQGAEAAAGPRDPADREDEVTDETTNNAAPNTVEAFALRTAAEELGFAELEVARLLAGSTWDDVGDMRWREFQGAYRGYHPKCRMDSPEEAVIAAVFDALARAHGDERRAVRKGTWVRPELGSEDPAADRAVQGLAVEGRTDG